MGWAFSYGRGTPVGLRDFEVLRRMGSKLGFGFRVDNFKLRANDFGVRVPDLGLGLHERVWGVQGNLAYQKTPTPPYPLKALGIGLLSGPRGVHFLIDEVPL